MGPHRERGGDERRTAIDERHRAECRWTIPERHGAGRRDRIRHDRCDRRGQRHCLTEDGRVWRGIQRRGGRRPDVDLSNHDREDIRLDGVHAGPSDIGALDAEEIRAEGAPRDRVGDVGVTDESGRRGRWRRRIPRKERPGVRRGYDAREVTGQRCPEGTSLVVGEIDDAHRVRNERPDAERGGHGVRCARDEAVRPNPFGI